MDLLYKIIKVNSFIRLFYFLLEGLLKRDLKGYGNRRLIDKDLIKVPKVFQPPNDRASL